MMLANVWLGRISYVQYLLIDRLLDVIYLFFSFFYLVDKN